MLIPLFNKKVRSVLMFTLAAILAIAGLRPGSPSVMAFQSPPNAPCCLALGGEVIEDTQIYLGFAWTDNSDNETGFRLYEKVGVDGTYFLAATVGANNTNVGGIEIDRNGSVYLFKLVAFNSAGESGRTNEVEIDSDTGSQVQPPLPNTPIALGISGEVITATQITLGFSWTDNSSDEDGFHLYQRVGTGGSYTLVATVGANVTSVGGITISRDGNTYYYIVKSFNANGESAASNTVSITAN